MTWIGIGIETSRDLIVTGSVYITVLVLISIMTWYYVPHTVPAIAFGIFCHDFCVLGLSRSSRDCARGWNCVSEKGLHETVVPLAAQDPWQLHAGLESATPEKTSVSATPAVANKCAPLTIMSSSGVGAGANIKACLLSPCDIAPRANGSGLDSSPWSGIGPCL